MGGTVFYKMTGSGNDFIMLDGRHERPERWPAERIIEVCDRRNGVGADGLVILTPERPGSVRMTFFNCDGSRAAMCGNAALCSTRLSAYLELAPGQGMALVTDAGTFPTRCLGNDSHAELNLPSFGLPQPVSALELRKGEEFAALATVGVPHLVVLVDNLGAEDLMERGRELRSHPALGPAGANVNFVCRPNGDPEKAWPVRTYERGVEGETLACGTGAVAAAVSLALHELDRLPLRMRTRSGRLLGIQATPDGQAATDVWLAGEGRLVFTGVL